MYGLIITRNKVIFLSMQFAFLGFFVLMCSRFWFLFFVYLFVFFVVVGGGGFFWEGVYLFVFVFVYHF